MSEESGDIERDRIVGLPIDEAVEQVTAANPDEDPETVRERLERVSEDGQVTEDALEDELSEVSEMVATPETKVELTEMVSDQAGELAEDDRDIPVVDHRLSAFESRLQRAQADAESLGPALQTTIRKNDQSTPVYEIVTDLHELRAKTSDLRQRTDDLKIDIESFQEWLDTATVRYRQFELDLSAVEDSLDELAEIADGVEQARADTDSDDPPAPTSEAALQWTHATLQHRMLGLMVTDLRTELDACEELAVRENRDDDAEIAEYRDTLDDLQSRWKSLDERVADLTVESWRDRYGAEISGFEDDLEAFEPPVDWTTVETTLQERRETILASLA